MVKKLLLFLMVLPVLLILCALMMVWTPLPHPLPPVGGGIRNRVSAIVVGILGLIYLGGLTVLLTSLVRGRARVLDPVLVPAGLSSEAYLVVGRHYHGKIENRAVEISFVPAYGFTPALLNVAISACLGTRMAVGQQRPQLDCTGCDHVALFRSELEDLCAVAKDREVAERLLSCPEISATLARLLIDGGAGVRELYLQPQRVWLRARPRHMTARSFVEWLDDLKRLARASENLLARIDGGTL